MRWTWGVDKNIVERCTFHCEHYGTNLEDKIGEVCIYYFLNQRFGEGNVNPPYVLKEDLSNQNDEIVDLPYVVKGETVQVITNGIERAHKGDWNAVGEVDLENESFVMTDFSKTVK